MAALFGMKQFESMGYLCDHNGKGNWEKLKPSFVFADDKYDYISGNIISQNSKSGVLTNLGYMDDPRWTSCKIENPGTHFGQVWTKWLCTQGRVYTRFFIPPSQKERAIAGWEKYLKSKGRSETGPFLPDSLFVSNFSNMGGGTHTEAKAALLDILSKFSIASINDQSIKNKAVALSIGHRVNSSGAALKIPTDNGNLSIGEYDFYQIIGNAIATALCNVCTVYIVNRYDKEIYVYKDGAKNLYSKTSTQSTSASADMQKINTLNDNISCALALHFNSVKDPNAKGCTTIYGNSSLEKSKKLASIIHNKILGALSNEDDKVQSTTSVPRAGFINSCRYPIALIEPFFESNKEDAQNVLNNLGPFVNALINGIVEYLKSPMASA